jgi:hypothetical protein
MRDRLDPESPVPLYWQVAEALRYRVATGELAPGERLPSLREAAAAWGINMHTVRRAYRTLAHAGIVRVRPRSGAVVLGRPDATEGAAPVPAGPGRASLDERRAGSRVREEALEGWLREVVRQGSERWGLGPRELGAALADLPLSRHRTTPVYVVECSESQAADLARQLSDRWRVAAEPWSLERDGEPPADAVLVGTYFHYNDIRVRWPKRFPRVRFVATRPDDGIRERLEAFRGAGDEPLPVVLWERDEAMARNIAADLVRILPEDRFAVQPRVGAPDSVPDSPTGPVLFSPRTWARLPEDARCREDLFEVRYVFERADVERVARELGWEDR